MDELTAHISEEADLLLKLVRFAFGTEDAAGKDLPDGEESCDVWRRTVSMSYVQMVFAIALDGLNIWHEANPGKTCGLYLPKLTQTKFKLLGTVMETERLYRGMTKAIGRLASLWSEGGQKMMLLKGYGLSLDYPVPSHRPPGDIDTYHFDRWMDADNAVRNAGIKVGYTIQHHSVFRYGEFEVESHYDILNRYTHSCNAEIDDILTEMARKDTVEVTVEGGALLLPSAEFNALYLLMHTSSHFAAEDITLKHVLDWGTFMEHHSSEVNWQKLLPLIRKSGMQGFFHCINGLCTDVFGFRRDRFPEPDCVDVRQEKMLQDILHPMYLGKIRNRLTKILFRIKRWFAYLWKKRIVYDNENSVLMFFRQLRSLSLKPEDMIRRKYPDWQKDVS